MLNRRGGRRIGGGSGGAVPHDRRGRNRRPRSPGGATLEIPGPNPRGRERPRRPGGSTSSATTWTSSCREPRRTPAGERGPRAAKPSLRALGEKGEGAWARVPRGEARRARGRLRRRRGRFREGLPARPGSSPASGDSPSARRSRRRSRTPFREFEARLRQGVPRLAAEPRSKRPHERVPQGRVDGGGAGGGPAVVAFLSLEPRKHLKTRWQVRTEGAGVRPRPHARHRQ